MVATATPKKAVVPTKADWLFGLVGDGVGVESKSGAESLLPRTSSSTMDDRSAVGEGVSVAVGVGVGIGVEVLVGIAVGVGVGIGVEVLVGIAVGVGVGIAVVRDMTKVFDSPEELTLLPEKRLNFIS